MIYGDSIPKWTLYLKVIGYILRLLPLTTVSLRKGRRQYDHRSTDSIV